MRRTSAKGKLEVQPRFDASSALSVQARRLSLGSLSHTLQRRRALGVRRARGNHAQLPRSVCSVPDGELRRWTMDQREDAAGCGSACEHGRSPQGVELNTRSDIRNAVVVGGRAGKGTVLFLNTVLCAPGRPQQPFGGSSRLGAVPSRGLFTPSALAAAAAAAEATADMSCTPSCETF
jgi:hypothetical protein